MDKAKIHDEMLDLELPIVEETERLLDIRITINRWNREELKNMLKRTLSDLIGYVERYKEYVEEL